MALWLLNQSFLRSFYPEKSALLSQFLGFFLPFNVSVSQRDDRINLFSFSALYNVLVYMLLPCHIKYWIGQAKSANDESV